MQFTILINQQKALEWGLNLSQAAVFSVIHQVPTWADEVIKDDTTFYAISKQKLVSELPVVTNKPDTAYRILKQLADKGLIELSHTSKITLVRLTEKGKEWNRFAEDRGNESVKHRKNIRPNLGNKSDLTSEKSPTDHITNNQITIDQKECTSARSVIDYLNEKTGSRFQPTPANLRLVKSRFSDGYSLDDVKAVIDAKCAEWRNDKTMSKYLRPKTLFSATNFDNYVGCISTGKTDEWWRIGGFESVYEAENAGATKYNIEKFRRE